MTERSSPFRATGLGLRGFLGSKSREKTAYERAADEIVSKTPAQRRGVASPDIETEVHPVPVVREEEEEGLRGQPGRRVHPADVGSVQSSDSASPQRGVTVSGPVESAGAPDMAAGGEQIEIYMVEERREGWHLSRPEGSTIKKFRLSGGPKVVGEPQAVEPEVERRPNRPL